ncbi:MAG TPA: hypothetical protein PKN09_00710 [Novosphingobium sp.]|nr:hypothetical protein [Novosphingobium sp.]
MDVFIVPPAPNDAVAAITAVANVLIAAAALVVAVISIRFTNAGIKSQREHNFLSVRPIPFIALADFENHIRVRIRNDGTGPLIVKSVSIREPGKKSKHGELVAYMPPLPADMAWANFSSGEIGSIPVGGEAILLELKLDEGKATEVAARDACRQALSKLEIGVTYSDVYNSEFPEKIRSLEWFGRRLAPSKAAQ